MCHIEESHTISNIWNSVFVAWIHTRSRIRHHASCVLCILICHPDNIHLKAYFTLTNIGKNPQRGAVSAFVPPLFQIITSSRSWSLTGISISVLSWVASFLIPIWGENLWTKWNPFYKWFFKSCQTTSSNWFGFLLRLARALSQVLRGISSRRAPDLRFLFMASPLLPTTGTLPLPAPPTPTAGSRPPPAPSPEPPLVCRCSGTA